MALSKKDYKEIGIVLENELNRFDNILLSTKDLIQSQVNNNFPYFPKYCPMRDDNYLISSKNELKKTLNSINDCGKCRFRGKYYAPVWKFKKYISFKKMVYKSIFDI